ncbi:MAG: PAS domain S-box protein [Deltaproteobacteria bacterium]|nr:PAS domain S-box protein [Deltaproteobacteria bacterium]
MDFAGADPASSAGDGSLPLLRRAQPLEQRLVMLMGARLALALVSLGIALALDTTLGDVDAPGRRGLYSTVAFAFLATAFYGLVLPRIQRPRRFAALNIATDIAIVSALVHFSGGPDSVFGFLYVLVAIYGALLFDRRGALVTACLGVFAYGGVLLLARAGAAGAPHGASTATPAVFFMLWVVHAGAIVLVAALASFLAAELRQRTSDLRLLTNLHERTVESLKSGLLTADRDGRITSFNPESERITGVASASAIGQDIEEIFPGIRELALAPASDNSAQGRIRAPYRNRRGEALHLGIATYILKDARGAPSGHVMIFQDVTEVVEMEAELRRSERLAAVGELSASIAHEIRNPLAAISGSVQLLEREADALGGAVEARRLMGIVLRETDRLNHLITDFLQYARPGPLHLEPVSLESVVGEVLEMFGSIMPENLRVELNVPQALAVRADAAQLRQLLWNLTLNACQAMPEGGSLCVEAQAVAEPTPQEARSARRNDLEEKKTWVEITVRDQGVGISPEVLEHVFDPFFTTKPEGSGLGLATVHRIVEEHGGSIRLESLVDRGTEIRIRLPRAEVMS